MKGTIRAAIRFTSFGIMSATLLGTACYAAPPPEIVISGTRVVPESLTSSQDGAVYFGSIQARTIYRAKPGSTTADAWIQPGTNGLLQIFGVLADDQSHTLWACSSELGGSESAAALHAFDLKTGAPKGRYPLPTAGGSCNDIAIGPDGTAYATDTSNMEVVRLRPGAESLEVWSPEGAFGPKGGVLDGISVLGNDVFVNTLATSKLFRVPIKTDGSAGLATEVNLDRTIDAPDGMRSFGPTSLLVVEGGGAGQLSRIDISGDRGHVTTINQGYPDGAVAVTVVGETAYVLESQVRTLRDPGAKAKPFHATSVRVGKP
jgi:sugar lactone lactonase YvrE